MHKVEIRTGVWVAYEDHWFGNPWTLPGTVVMVHGNSESSLAWRPWVPHLAGKYRVIRLDMPGFGASTEPLDYAWTARELAADIARRQVASLHMLVRALKYRVVVTQPRPQNSHVGSRCA